MNDRPDSNRSQSDSSYDDDFVRAVEGNPLTPVLRAAVATMHAMACSAAEAQGLSAVIRVHDTARVRLRVLAATSLSQAATNGGATTCRKGCNACCRFDVEATPLDVFRAADAVLRLPDAERASARARVTEAAERTASLTQQARFAAQIPCPLLLESEGTCLIYEHRPSSCEGYHVASHPSACGSDQAVMQIPMPKMVSMGAWAAVQPVLDTLPLDTRIVAFIGALDLCLRRPDVARAWQRGVAVFDEFARYEQ